MMGQEGPKTVEKCRMRGMRFVRYRVSIITAAFELFVAFNSLARTILSWGFDFWTLCVLDPWVRVEGAADVRLGELEEGCWIW